MSICSSSFLLFFPEPPSSSSSFSGSPRRIPFSRMDGNHSSISFAIPKVLLFPDLSGAFFSPSSDILKQGGRKRSIRLARGKLKNFLVSNNQSKPVRICPEIQINDSSAFFVRSSNLSLEAKLKCLCLISPRGGKGGGKEK